MSDPADLFRTLSPDAQAAALVRGVVEPHVHTASQVKALEELAFEARNRPAAAKKRGPSTRRRRLAWELREEFGEIAATPREQNAGRSTSSSSSRCSTRAPDRDSWSSVPASSSR